MAGIYIHIPFCKQACNYCNFHFSTSLKQKDALVAAIAKELAIRAPYLDQKIETVYFGGGTPSLLNVEDLDKIWTSLYKNYKVDGLLECTLEANPDDVTKEYLKMLQLFPIDRLSMGIQSFKEADLRYMNRAHNAKEAESAVKLAQDKGFENITIDLIYGTPGLSNADWKQNLEKAIQLAVPHISSYALTVEEKTKLAHDIKAGKAPAPKSESAAAQFEILVEMLANAGFSHYEISNFAQANHFAIHNTNYWKGKKYLGIGPSAHSFDGDSRQWNVANNALYIKAIEQGKPDFEKEILSAADQMNESILTGLRTIWGLDLAAFEIKFGAENFAALRNKMDNVAKKHILVTSENAVLTEAGKLFADGIAADLFFD